MRQLEEFRANATQEIVAKCLSEDEVLRRHHSGAVCHSPCVTFRPLTTSTACL
jgi:hypothetical protein